MVITAAEISNPDYVPETWHIYLVFLGFLILEGLLTMNTTKFLGRLNEVGTIVNLILLVIFFVWFPAGSISSPKANSNDYVWTEFDNGTEWPTGIAFLMGFLTVIYTSV